MRYHNRGRLAFVVGALMLALAVTVILLWSPSSAEIRIAGGRIAVIEAATLGTNHLVGTRSWFPSNPLAQVSPRWAKYLEPKWPRSELSTELDSLLVWGHLSRTGAVYGTATVLSHGIEIVDSTGRVWGSSRQELAKPRRSFARTADVFDAYPRWEKELDLRLVPVSGEETYVVRVRNPRVSTRADWRPDLLPIEKECEGYTIVMRELRIRSVRVRARGINEYWEPVIHVLRTNRLAWGWEKPTWHMTDPWGNHGPMIGLGADALRYQVTIMPKSENLEATIPLMTLPMRSLANRSQPVVWNLSTNPLGRTLTVRLLSFANKNTFADGVFQPDPSSEPTLAPVGWTTMGVGAVRWNTHSTRQPTIYLHTRDEDLGRRLGVRLRDDRGRLHSATPDPAGPRDGIFPYLLDLPASITNLTPEIVLLQPLEAEFTVRTPAAAQP